MKLENCPACGAPLNGMAICLSEKCSPDPRPTGRADMNDLIKRLDNIAEVLVESRDYSQFCHAIYEAGAEISRLTAERDALKGQESVIPLWEQDMYALSYYQKKQVQVVKQVRFLWFWKRPVIETEDQWVRYAFMIDESMKQWFLANQR